MSDCTGTGYWYADFDEPLSRWNPYGAPAISNPGPDERAFVVTLPYADARRTVMSVLAVEDVGMPAQCRPHGDTFWTVPLQEVTPPPAAAGVISAAP